MFLLQVVREEPKGSKDGSEKGPATKAEAAAAAAPKGNQERFASFSSLSSSPSLYLLFVALLFAFSCCANFLSLSSS